MTGYLLVLGVAAGTVVLVARLRACPVVRMLSIGMGHWAATCRDQNDKIAALPTYRPHDPIEAHQAQMIAAARRVA